MDAIKVTTAAGCPVTVDPQIGDDWELLEMMSEVDDDPSLIIKIFKKLLGDDQYKDVKDNLKAKNGRISVTDMAAEMTSIFEAASALKNS